MSRKVPHPNMKISDSQRRKMLEGIRRKWAEPDYRAFRAAIQIAISADEAMSAIHYFSTQNEARNEKIGIRSRELWRDPAYRIKLLTPEKAAKARAAGRLHKNHTEETKRLISAASKRLLSNPARRREYSDRVKTVAQQGGIAEALRGPKRNTSIELALQEELLKRGIEFLTHVPMQGTVADIFLPSANVAIFADGCYWHGCKTHNPERTEKRLNDQKKRLAIKGKRVIVLWEHQIKESPKDCIDFALLTYDWSQNWDLISQEVVS